MATAAAKIAEKDKENYMKSLSSNPDENVKIDDVVISKRTFKKIELQVKQEMFRQVIRDSYRCSACGKNPRPDSKAFTVCANCSCMTHAPLVVVEV